MGRSVIRPSNDVFLEASGDGNVPFKAAATSRMFLKWVERYSPLDVETVVWQCIRVAGSQMTRGYRSVGSRICHDPVVVDPGWGEQWLRSIVEIPVVGGWQ